MHSINQDPTDKIMVILPSLQEYVRTHKEYGEKPILVQDFKRILKNSYTAKNYPSGKSTMNRSILPFLPYTQKKSKFIDNNLIRCITLEGIPDEAVYDILYFHHCWANPLLRKIIETTIYPYMIAKDQVTRERVMNELTETAGQYNRNSIQNIFTPMTKHGFMTYDKQKKKYTFTNKSIHPVTLLYTTYRELQRLGLKLLGVHRIDSLMELEYTKWLLVTRSQFVDIVKKLDENKFAGYSFQLEEQLHIKYSFEEFLERLKTKGGDKK